VRPKFTDVAALALAVSLAACTSTPTCLVEDVACAVMDEFDAALAAMNDEDYPRAARLLDEITTAAPDLSGPWANLGVVRAELGDEVGARDAYQRAITLDERNCTAQTGLGILARNAGEFAQAEVHYRACLAADSEFAPAQLDLAILLELYLGRLPDALAAYRQYQAMESEDDPRVSGWIADLERRLAREDS